MLMPQFKLYLIGRSPPAPQGHVLRAALWVYNGRNMEEMKR